MTERVLLKGGILGLSAAALFGLSAPLAKLLLPSAGPLLLAGLLYLGGGAGLWVYGALRREERAREARLRRADLWPLLGVLLCGGILGPVLLLFGLSRVSAVVGSLLLNLEAPFTILVAVALFREHLGWRGIGAAALIVGGAALLGLTPGELEADWVGVLAIAGACLSWAVDNNLTQKLSLRDPVAVVRFKALGAGACNLALGLLVGQKLPALSLVGWALLVGLFGYGISIVLDMRALRLLGAAREAAFFATAPFIGALASIPLLREGLSPGALLAMGAMVVGVILLIGEHHSHSHSHEEMEHDHLHAHDDGHHQHEHESGLDLSEPHSHPHRHLPLVHDHPHTPDLHHRHSHGKVTLLP